jgi:hypothetical protein
MGRLDGEKMSKKARLEPPQEELLSRYLKACREAASGR